MVWGYFDLFWDCFCLDLLGLFLDLLGFCGLFELFFGVVWVICDCWAVWYFGAFVGSFGFVGLFLGFSIHHRWVFSLGVLEKEETYVSTKQPSNKTPLQKPKKIDT